MPGDLQASWVLECLLLEPMEDNLINKVFLSLPISNPIHPCLRRAILLRRLASELSRRTVSETTLSSLELLEELRRGEGSAPSDALKAAYCAVAAHVTAASLRHDGGGGFRDVAERVWRRRIGDLRRSEAAAGLVSPSLEGLMEVAEAAISDDASGAQLAAVDTLEDALVAAALFLSETLDSSGPSFLDLLDQAVDGEEERSKVFDHPFAKPMAGAPEVAGTGINPSRSVIRELDCLGGGHDEVCRINGGGDGGGVVDEARSAVDNLEPFDRGFDVLPSPEVQRAKEALISSCADLQAVVRDPLPDVIKIAEAIDLREKHIFVEGSGAMPEADEVVCDISVENMPTSDEATQNGRHDLRPVASPVNPIQTDEGIEADKDFDTGVTEGTNNLNLQREKGKGSMMDRKPNACTYEWDSLDSSSSSSSKRIRLPRSKDWKVSPLRNVEIKPVALRRKKKRWSIIEEDTLREGVEKYGKGNWKCILTNYKEIFEERTEVDLKDKWRNLTK